MTAIQFVLDISLGEIAHVRHDRSAPPALDALTWLVQRDGERVTIHALLDGRVRELARASWVQGRLIERRSELAGCPTDAQWTLVATALGRVARRTDGRTPRWRRTLAAMDPKTLRILIGAVIAGVAAIALVAVLFVIRTRDPITTVDELVARHARLAWADVATGTETTVPRVLKDPDRERDRRLCVTGTVVEIARHERRPVHVGALRTGDADEVRFVALGSTGTLVKRSAAVLCGVAAGKLDGAPVIVGMFDLPENR